MKKRSRAALLALGTLLLVGFAATLSTSRSPILSMAPGSQSAAAVALWQSQYQVFEIGQYGAPADMGWPLSHRQPAYTSRNPGYCNYVYYNTHGYPNNSACPVPSYVDLYVQNNPSQEITAVVNLLGWYSPTQNYDTPKYTGSIPTVAAGTPLTLEWACQNTYTEYVNYGSCSSYDAFGNCNSVNGGTTAFVYYLYSGAMVNNVLQPNVGRMTVTPTQTTTYNVYCKSAGWNMCSLGCMGSLVQPSTPTMSFTVNVSGQPPPPPLPTETIDAGAGPGVTKTVTIGTAVTITATYAAHGTDTLLQTAIDGPNSTNSVPGIPFSAPFSPKQYVFTATTSGSYIFYPSLQSNSYPAWNNYSASVTVVATPPAACTDPHASNPPTCGCNIGYTGPNGGPCVPATCSDPNTVSPPTCACKPGYSGPNGGPCVAVSPTSISSFTVLPSRVTKNKPTTVIFSWAGSNLPPGGCSISGTSISGAVSPKSAGITIANSTVYTLTCGTVTKQTTVGLLPAYKEI